VRAHREGWRRAASDGAAVIALVCLVATFGYPWGSKGHRIINLNAVMQLPNSMATLKADSLFYEAHSSDADYRKNSSDTSFFAEAQRHFIDIDAYPEYLRLPHNRDSVVALYGWETVKRNGTLPWATQLVLDSLTAQLGRADTMAKYTMSDLGHYVADAHQPLHCAVNYDGQFTNNNGIHSRYETGMINNYAALLLITPDSIQYVGAPLDFIFAYIGHANSLVDSILEADTYAKASSGWNGNGEVPSSYYAALWEKTQGLTKDQFQQATNALASLWYTAWVNAAKSTSVHELAEVLPESFRLEQNFPNPFNPTTTIRFAIPVGTHNYTCLRVFDVLGRDVATLVNGFEEPGYKSVQWDASGVASGVYFYRLQAGDLVQTRKLLLLR
jgi:hypothetical protein